MTDNATMSDTNDTILPDLPIEIIIEIATHDHGAFATIARASHGLRQELAKKDKLQLFTNCSIKDTFGDAIIEYRLKKDGRPVLKYDFLKCIEAIHIYVDDEIYIDKVYEKLNGDTSAVMISYAHKQYPDRTYLSDRDTFDHALICAFERAQSVSKL
ncbi:hypothetical protein F-M6_0031 [Faustovirus]|nr:hypothetical protein F-M6_0031 [Faustovirus]